jgi:hypothetical protein
MTEKNAIVFYCKTCEKVIANPKKLARKYVYICPECKTKNVAFGTEKSIKNFYHIEEAEQKENREKKEQEKQEKPKAEQSEKKPL